MDEWCSCMGIVAIVIIVFSVAEAISVFSKQLKNEPCCASCKHLDTEMGASPHCGLKQCPISESDSCDMYENGNPFAEH